MQNPLNASTTVRSIITGSLIGLVLALTFGAGFLVRDMIEIAPVIASDIPPEEAGYPLLDEVQSLLDQVYLREQPSYIERQYAAIRGMLGAVNDPNTFFIDPPVARSEADVLAGTYGGIGVQVVLTSDGDYILYPFEDGPAQQAGILDGAVLLAINGDPVELGDSIDALDQMMRGEVKDGNGVELSVLQDDLQIDVFVEFDVINVPSVVWRVLDPMPDIGYLQILRFTNRTPEEVREAVIGLENAGVRAVVVDLRNNSGGLLQESIQVADEFLSDGIIVYEVTQADEKAFDAESGGAITELPLVTLINRGTASAAELVAGALQANERSLLVGQQTFGKGTVQQIFTLSDGSSVHITSAEWLTANREPISGVGLAPDIAMIPADDGRDVELNEALRLLATEIAEE